MSEATEAGEGTSCEVSSSLSLNPSYVEVRRLGFLPLNPSNDPRAFREFLHLLWADLNHAFVMRASPVRTFAVTLAALVYHEQHATAIAAIQRQKNIEHWSRKWKIDLFRSLNPDWRDLWDDVAR